MKKINEIFYSLQGEGYWTGTPTIFVRFSGCNLKCPFCDTLHEQGVMMSDEEIVAEVSKHEGSHVVLTGGEPSLYVDEALVEALHKAGKTVAMETNGTHAIAGNIDWITCSPKPYKTPVIERVNELKIVFLGQDFKQYDNIKSDHFFLQPCYEPDGSSNIEEVMDYILKHPKWRMSLQTHKMIGIR